MKFIGQGRCEDVLTYPLHVASVYRSCSSVPEFAVSLPSVHASRQTTLRTREFDAELSLVWDAFTKAEILDQWTAPAPWTAKTKYMDFKVGGRRFYAMVSPEGMERWAIQKYTSITPKTNFKMYNAFADKD